MYVSPHYSVFCRLKTRKHIAVLLGGKHYSDYLIFSVSGLVIPDAINNPGTNYGVGLRRLILPSKQAADGTQATH